MFRERFSSVCVCHLVLVLAGLVAAARADVPVQLVGRCPSYWVRGVQVAGNYAYVADFSGLRLVDISNPALPVFVGTCPGEYTMGFALSAPYVYQGDWWYDQALGYGWGCFQVYDITNPAGPVQTGAWCDYDYTPLSVAAAGGYAYVVDGNYILQVWGVSDPAAPTVVGECSANASDLAISGGYLYAAGAGLGVFDISNPVAPVQVGGCATTDHAEGMAVSGGYAYLANARAGLQVIGISDPAAPVHVGACDTSGWACAVAVSGGYAYVADGDAGLQVINVSNPAAPVRVGGYNGGGPVYDVDVAGGYVYVADWSRGLLILRVGPEARPGDLNCDGGVDFDDINPFVAALISQEAYESRYPDCRWLNGDIDGSGAVDFDDISPFVLCLVHDGCL